jgi:hypothetical protein
MTRVFLAIAFLAVLAAPSLAQPQADVAPVAALLHRLEAALMTGTPDAYLDLLSATANRDRCLDFARATVVPGVTRAVVKERDRTDLLGTLPGEGYRLLVEVFLEIGGKAQLSTWQLDVRQRSSANDWGIVTQEMMTSVQGLYRLSLNPRRQIEVRDLAVTSEDLTLTSSAAEMFLAETDEGPTAAVVVGRGEMRFAPTPATERSQLRVVSGSEAISTPFENAFVRVSPYSHRDHIAAREQSERRVVDPNTLRRAQEIFRQEIVKSFGLDLGDLSSDIWSLLPAHGDFLAEVRTRRFGTLTYTRSTGEVEDISLFSRSGRHNLSIYSSNEHLLKFGRFYSEDDKADYAVQSYDIDVAYNPEHRRLSGRARLSIEAMTDGLTSLSIRLAESLAVQSVVSPQLGRLLSVRVRNQNSVVVNLPTVIMKGYRMDLDVAYAGEVNPQAIDRESVWPQGSPQQQDEDEELVPVEESYLLSNRSYWYPQSPVAGYSTARLRVTLEEPWSAVGSGELVIEAPAPGPVEKAARRRLFSFVVGHPIRYLSLLVSRLTEVRRETVPLEAELGRLASERPPGVYNSDVDVVVKSNPRLRGRGRELAATSAAILRFYTSLIGDVPYSPVTVASIERRLPGGHSPAYMAVVASVAPMSRVRWSEDPAALPGFPEFFEAHELAHQWWGQAVGWKNYHEQWLSEGIAQYFSALYAEQSRGKDVFDGVIRRMQQWAMDESNQGPVYLGYRIGHVKRDSRLFRAVVYDKGAMVLHMLRRLVGDEAFFSGLRRFYYTWRFKKAGTNDLQRAMESAARTDLSRFFERWVFGERLPVVLFTAKVDEGAAEALLRFEQAGDVYDVPVTVTIEYADNSTSSVLVKLRDRIVETRVPLAGKVRKIDANRDQGALGTFR